MGSIEAQPKVTIPLINIFAYLAGDPTATKSCAAELRSACENQGFLQVVGHSVSPAIQNRFLTAIAAFFALLLLEKAKLSQNNSPCHRGYQKIGGQKLDELDISVIPDQKEGFSIRPERPLGRFLGQPNQWPEERVLPGVREAYMDYFK
jgi:isopenicillin N synthase-like dioxygenase